MVVFALALMHGVAGAQAQEAPVAFTGARIIPVDAPEIDAGVVVVHKGKIVAVGPAATTVIPVDAKRVDCAGKVIMPGIVDTHSHLGGIAGADGSSTVQPDVRVMDSINPADSGFRRALAGGLTTLNIMPGSGHLLSGQTVYVKLRAVPGAEPRDGVVVRIEDLAIRNADGTIAGGIKMANGTNPMRDAPFSSTRGKHAAIVRQMFIDAQQYARKLAEATAPDGTVNAEKVPARDLGKEALGKALSRSAIIHHHTHRADDIATVLRISEEFNLRVVLQHVSEASLIPAQIKEAQDAGSVLGCSVILIDSPGGKLEAVNLNYDTGRILDEAGVLVCFHTDDWITDSRLFLRMAALAVRAGMKRDSAIKALTINGAIMMDLQDRIGTLTPGKDADLVILSGDPFSVYTKVEQTWVEGSLVFDRSRPVDRLHAVGGWGAGRDQEPYFCCFGSGSFAFKGQQYQFGGGNSAATDTADTQAK